MKVPMKWLADFVESNLPAEELAHRLTMAGLEVEAIHNIGAEWDRVFVGAVLSVERHPDADRLVLADVEAGPHRLTVVTGAPNIASGQIVPLALTGASLIDGHSDSGERRVLKPVTMRGVKSEGMVCSEKELGLSDEHEGILVLPEDAPVGSPLADYLGDTVLEFEITPNLVHDFSVAGIAREAAAVTKGQVSNPSTLDLGACASAENHLVSIQAHELCPRYMALVVDGITIQPSPEWLARRLLHAGVRPINNVVDITNYVMLEQGQPLHAFDLDRLKDERIVVRRARDGETLTTIDHVDRKLSPSMLVIADAQSPVAIAGVMGGVDSEVSEKTRAILLEGANFDMSSVRHTARALKLRTDASARFERGLDPNLVGSAMARAAALLLETCPGASIRSVADVYPEPVSPVTLDLPVERVERVLGVDYPIDQMLAVLARLEFQPQLITVGDSQVIRVTVPTYRHDVSLAEDLVEEISRVIGYDTLPETLPLGQTVPVQRDPVFLLQRHLRSLLTAFGMTEVVTYVTTSAALLDRFATGESGEAGVLRSVPTAEALTLRNPLQADRDRMRTTLAPALLETAAQNLKHARTVKVFELARLYLPSGQDALPDEPDVLGLLMTGERETISRFGTPGELDFFDLKGAVEEIFARAGLDQVEYLPAEHPSFHPGRTAEASFGGERLALFGELRPDLAADFGLGSARVAFGELDVRRLTQLLGASNRDHTAPRFLPVEQDFAFVILRDVPAAEVERAVRAGAGPLATSVTLFDVYEGEQLGTDRRSLAYRVTFTAPDRALTDAELVKVRDRIEKQVRQRVKGELRA